MTAFKPILGALATPQRTLWQELREAPVGFVLYGGTALALRLGHRQSQDFDFFSTATFEARELRPEVRFLRGAKVMQEATNTLTCVVERGGPIQVSFFGGLGLRRVGEPDICPENRVLLASLLDLAACKAEVVQHRAEAKDYLDVAALLAAGVNLEMILAAGRAVFGGEFEPSRTLRALTFFEDGNLPELDEKVLSQLRNAVAEVRLEELPVLASRPGLSTYEA